MSTSVQDLIFFYMIRIDSVAANFHPVCFIVLFHLHLLELHLELFCLFCWSGLFPDHVMVLSHFADWSEIFALSFISRIDYIQSLVTDCFFFSFFLKDLESQLLTFVPAPVLCILWHVLLMACSGDSAAGTRCRAAPAVSHTQPEPELLQPCAPPPALQLIQVFH